MIISFLNNKGGVGKTTSALILAHYFGAYNPDKKVLCIDLDPQTNLTTSLYTGMPTHTLSIFFEKDSDAYLRQIIYPTKFENVNLIGNSLKTYAHGVLNSTKIEMFKRDIEDLKDDYDYIILDCPSNLGQEITLANSISDKCFLPLQEQEFSYDGFEVLIKELKQVSRFNPKLVATGFLSMKSRRKNTLKEALNKLFIEYDIFDNDLFIPESTAIAGISSSENLFTDKSLRPDAKEEVLTFCKKVLEL